MTIPVHSTSAPPFRSKAVLTDRTTHPSRAPSRLVFHFGTASSSPWTYILEHARSSFIVSAHLLPSLLSLSGLNSAQGPLRRSNLSGLAGPFHFLRSASPSVRPASRSFSFSSAFVFGSVGRSQLIGMLERSKDWGKVECEDVCEGGIPKELGKDMVESSRDVNEKA